VVLKGGRRGSFEVTVDGVEIHSKLATGEWADTDRVLAAIASRIGT
jgi:selT/selW/selH-like putative selenoprotein